MSILRSAPRLGLGLLLLGPLAACQESYARREGISLAAGDAVAANKAVHVIDPWPAGSQNTRIETSGRRVAAAIERYETRAEAAGAPAGGLVFAPVPFSPGAPGGAAAAP